ncbi:SDR family oxidoreductase [Azospirillum sp. TSO35-2]|uniref:SDR family oxidoreductase n=1 Tax=Azospirillum sp. TSO35-2 TaxID=716796 RepID=UPI000D611CC1|nr:SDR family oxidoreductase [Azospirillum sp. TSO35-2]PWC32833.1 3-ketoacyl-ACP reductase [Azospirillum sp. TSO35-2]
MSDKRQRNAIVTGASRGIGAAIARRLANDGLAVIVNYAGSREAAEEVVRSITRGGGTARAVRADISDPAGFTTLFDEAEHAFGRVDVLVNNAGIMTLSPITDTDDVSFARQVDTNLGGVFRGLREAGRRIADGGRVINLSTSVVGLYQPTYGVYAATKAAIEALTHIAAKEFGARSITVNAVAPGPVATDLFLTGKPETLIDNIRKMNPLGRLGQPDDIASVVAFLAGTDSGWINGQVIRANGGVV